MTHAPRRCTAAATLAAWVSVVVAGPLACAAHAAAVPSTPIASPPRLIISAGGTSIGRCSLQRVGEEAFRRIGMKMQLVHQPSERALVEADAGEVDGNGARVAGLEDQHPNLIRVPEPLFSSRFVAFARQPSTSLDGGWHDVQSRRVAFLNGWKIFEEHAGRARTVHRVDRPEQLFRMLDAGRVDLVLYTLADGLHQVEELGLTHVVPLQPPLAEVPLYLYLHRRHAALVPQLTQVLRQMRADGTVTRLLAATDTP